jgi:hypothetical protein
MGNGKGSTRSSPGSRSKRRPMPRKAQGNRVLLFGRLRELALYRAEVLRSEGFAVPTPDTKEEAVATIRRGNFDVAILTYTLSSDTVQELAELIREYCPDAPPDCDFNLKKRRSRDQSRRNRHRRRRPRIPDRRPSQGHPHQLIQFAERGVRGPILLGNEPVP